MPYNDDRLIEGLKSAEETAKEAALKADATLRAAAALKVDTETLIEQAGRVEEKADKIASRWVTDFLTRLSLVVFGVILIYVVLQNRENGEILVDCNTPGTSHACFNERNDARDESIRIVNDVVIYAFECFKEAPVEQLRACVRAKLAEQLAAEGK